MRIDIRELELGPLSLTGKVPVGELDFGGQEILIAGDVHVMLTAERQGREIRVRGRFEVDVQLPCSRCLEPVRVPVAADFDQFYHSNSEHPLFGEIELKQDETEIAFFSGHFIDVSDIVREQILLSLPMKPVCRENCKGLCPHCGKNQNLESCDCEALMVDPRLEPLLKLKNRMNF